MVASLLQNSFVAGELSPALYARTDIEKYASGAAVLRNWFIDYRGGASTKPGTEFIGACKAVSGQPRLIPFIVSTAAAYALEFGDHYVRFIADGAYLEASPGVPYELASPYASADLPAVKFDQSANVLTLAHPAYPPYDLRRTTPTTFTLLPDSIGPTILAPTTVNAVQRNGAAAKSLYGYIITAVNAAGEESLPAFPAFTEGDILDQNSNIENEITWNIVADAVRYVVYKVGPTASGNSSVKTPVPTVYGFIGDSSTTSFTDNNIAADYGRTPPLYQDPFAPGQIAEINVTGGGTGYTGPLTSLVFTGGGGTGASGYGIIDSTGAVVGVVITNPGKNYATAPAISDDQGSTATYTCALGQLTGTYPAVVGYFQQRRLFGATPNFPESFVASQTGQYNNFNTNVILEDSDAITASLASRQVNAIKSFTATSTGLVVLTSGGGFLVSGGSPEAAISPTNLTALPQASSGASDLPPIPINSSIIYGQAKGAVIRDLAFNFYVQAFSGTDRSVLASHLFTGFRLQEWTYAEEPFRLVHLIRSDGAMLIFTYVPEQEIFAWTRWDTDGFYRSVCSIPEGDQNAVYIIIQRFIEGTYRYYTERVASRLFSQLADAWTVDCGLTTPRAYPTAMLSLDAATGTTIARADAPVFAPGDVGSTIWAGGSSATVTAYGNTQQVTVDVIRPFPVVLDNTNSMPVPYPAGEWELDPPLATISGLDHLEGQVITGLADGQVVGPLTVTLGAVTLPSPASIVTLGLGFQCQLQTLRLDAGSPTVQGKRKLITAQSAIVNQSLGLQVGASFDPSDLYDIKDLAGGIYPPTLVSAVVRDPISGTWTTDGQICFQQDLPLPATILGVVQEVVPGDTGR